MSSRKALAYSFVDRYAGLLLAVASSMVVARLLTPAEIGVFSVSMVMLSFISVLRDFGAGQYLVQEKELTTERIRAVWALQLGLGVRGVDPAEDGFHPGRQLRPAERLRHEVIPAQL